MQISIFDLKVPSIALVLTNEQKKELQNLFHKEKIKLIISRKSIRIKRLDKAYKLMSNESKLKIEQILN